MALNIARLEKQIQSNQPKLEVQGELDVATGKTFYSTDADTIQTGTLVPIVQSISGGIGSRTRVVTKTREDPALTRL